MVYEQSDSEDDSDDELPESEITYGDSTYELVLASGARIGHRAHKNIHKQNLAPYLGQNPFTPSAHSSPSIGFKPSPHSLALLSLVPKIMPSDKTHARPLYASGLIPAKGAGAGGNGDVIKAKNKGEAKNASKHVRTFRELKEFNKQSFIRGVKANSQEHYRFVIFYFLIRVDADYFDPQRSSLTIDFWYWSIRIGWRCILQFSSVFFLFSFRSLRSITMRIFNNQFHYFICTNSYPPSRSTTE